MLCSIQIMCLTISVHTHFSVFSITSMGMKFVFLQDWEEEYIHPNYSQYLDTAVKVPMVSRIVSSAFHCVVI